MKSPSSTCQHSTSDTIHANIMPSAPLIVTSAPPRHGATPAVYAMTQFLSPALAFYSTPSYKRPYARQLLVFFLFTTPSHTCLTWWNHLLQRFAEPRTFTISKLIASGRIPTAFNVCLSPAHFRTSFHYRSLANFINFCAHRSSRGL